MNSFFSDPRFHIVGIPILFVIIGVLANRLGRKDNDNSPPQNLWAVGTTLLLMSLGTVFADMRTAIHTDISCHLG